MNNRLGFYMAFTVSLMIFTMMYAGYQGPANYPVAEIFRVGYAEMRMSIEFDVGPNPQPLTCAFDIWHPNDVVLDVNVPGITLQRGRIDSTGPGFLYEYYFLWTPPAPGMWTFDVIAADPNGAAMPEYRPGRGIVKAFLLDPNYDYTLAMVDPREYQKAVKVTHRYQYLQRLPIHYGNILELMP